MVNVVAGGADPYLSLHKPVLKAQNPPPALQPYADTPKAVNAVAAKTSSIKLSSPILAMLQEEAAAVAPIILASDGGVDPAVAALAESAGQNTSIVSYTQALGDAFAQPAPAVDAPEKTAPSLEKTLAAYQPAEGSAQ